MELVNSVHSVYPEWVFTARLLRKFSASDKIKHHKISFHGKRYCLLKFNVSPMDETVQETRISEAEIANIVATGKFDVELDLANVAEDLTKAEGIDSAEHSRRSGNRLLIHFANQDTLSILVPSGVYMFTGVDSYRELEYAKSELLSALAELGIISSPNPASKEIIDPFQVQNVVCTAELNRQKGLNLNQLAISLGLEKTEYEPEQFPGLVYRPNSSSCTILVFSSGKMVITGIDDKKTAELELEGLQQKLDLQ